MNKPDSIENALQNQLDQSIDTLDDATLEKLKAARMKALSAAQAKTQVESPNTSSKVISLNAFRQISKPALGLAASILLVAPLMYFNVNSDRQTTQVAVIDSINNALAAEQTPGNTIDLITSFAELNDDEFDMVDELDFALWLVEQENTAPAVRG